MDLISFPRVALYFYSPARLASGHIMLLPVIFHYFIFTHTLFISRCLSQTEFHAKIPKFGGGAIVMCSLLHVARRVGSPSSVVAQLQTGGRGLVRHLVSTKYNRVYTLYL